MNGPGSILSGPVPVDERGVMGVFSTSTSRNMVPPLWTLPGLFGRLTGIHFIGQLAGPHMPVYLRRALFHTARLCVPGTPVILAITA